MINKNEDQEVQADDEIQDLTIVADPGQSPMRIDKFLMERVLHSTRSKLQNAIKAGAITVNKMEVKPNYRIRPKDSIHVVLARGQKWTDNVVPEDIPLDIRFEDDDLMVVYKPAGMVVHPGISNTSGTLVNALAYYFKNSPIPAKEGNNIDRMGLVHRIDKNTSGLLVIGKTDFALSHLAKQFYNHTIDREYVALVWGEPEPANGTIKSYLGRSLTNRTKFQVWDEEEGIGKLAVTHYETIQPMYYVSLVKCKLETGRTHQIRVHMSHQNNPLFSDEKYGGDNIVKGTVFNKYKQFVMNAFKLCPRQALHARFLGFEHPVTKQRMEFESPLPDDMKAVIEKWENYVQSKQTD